MSIWGKMQTKTEVILEEEAYTRMCFSCLVSAKYCNEFNQEHRTFAYRCKLI